MCPMRGASMYRARAAPYWLKGYFSRVGYLGELISPLAVKLFSAGIFKPEFF